MSDPLEIQRSIQVTEDELWDLVDKWREAALKRERGPYLSDNPETAWGQGISEAAEDLSDLILACEDRQSAAVPE